MLDIWTLAFAFGFQIYFDFSGYRRSRSLGTGAWASSSPELQLALSATDPRDFWKRWHISLSSWIRDYLYLPLQG